MKQNEKLKTQLLGMKTMLANKEAMLRAGEVVIRTKDAALKTQGEQLQQLEVKLRKTEVTLAEETERRMDLRDCLHEAKLEITELEKRLDTQRRTFHSGKFDHKERVVELEVRCGSLWCRALF